MKTYLKLFFGINLLSLGIIIVLRVNVGMDPFDSLSYLIGNILNLDLLGNAILITHFIFFLLLLTIVPFNKKKLVECGISLVSISIITRVINFYENLIYFEPQSLLQSAILFIIGFMTINYGLYLIANVNFIIPPYDKFVVELAEKKNINIGSMRLICDIIVFIVIITGYLIDKSSVTLSIGTVIFAIGTGPNISLYEKMFSKETNTNEV